MAAIKARRDTGRDTGPFIALPWSVTDSPAFRKLSVHARALLLDVARQYVRDNNGRLLLSRAYMAPLGWTSVDMLTKAKRELLDGGFIHETVKGHRPNKASWYAITWQALDRHPGFDPGAAESFRKGAYRAMPTPAKPTKEDLYRKWDKATPAPPHGTGATAATHRPPTLGLVVRPLDTAPAAPMAALG